MAPNETNDTQMENASLLSRRDVLQRAGLAVAAAAFPAAGKETARPLPPFPASDGDTRADFPVGDVMKQLSSYMSEARDRALPDDVVEQAKWHLLDTFAAMISGSELPAGRAATKFARAYGGKEVCTVVADTVVCGPIEAALANAVLAHSDETDDHGPGGHTGSNVVPAALALGEQFNISGTHFLRAMALGYDIATRVLVTVQPGLRNTHRLSFAIGGVFGATAAASCAAGLTAQQMRWALSYAAQQCSGLDSFPRDLDHIEKGFIFSGMGARNGVTSALLVHTGWTAVNDIMSGPDNYLMEWAPTGNPELLVEKLGERYDLMRSDIKRWTVGAPMQNTMDALEALLKRQPIDPSQVEEIVLRYMPDSITDNSGFPDINVQYATAVMLTDKTVTFRAIHNQARMRDPGIVALRDKVKLQPGTRGGERPPLVTIVLKDGTRLVQDDVKPGLLGTAANPMSKEQLVSKARELMTPVLGTAPTSHLIDRVFEIDKMKDVRELRPLLQRTYAGGPPKLSEYPKPV